MQVSHVSSENTHAVIGGGEARAFGMSESAEFFTVLSDTLYRDKKLAVVREIVCNAWDAHIASGNTDVPIEIEISQSEMTIRDFGPGIHDQKIGDIYCVYGNSTKKADKTQTGGFGLGSKAPFAYTDHFTVTSCHDGVKSVYAISRGGLETEGRPDFRKMVSVPTTESGVTVKIPLKETSLKVSHASEFEKIVKRVVLQGGILATLNKEPLARIDYDKARDHGFLIADKSKYSLTEAPVYVLIGTVLYPVVSTDSKIENWVDEISSTLPRNYDIDSSAILFAKPGTIGITPSRESLSFTEKSVRELQKLMKNYLQEISQNKSKVLSRKIQSHSMAGTELVRDLVAERGLKFEKDGIASTIDEIVWITQSHMAHREIDELVRADIFVNHKLKTDKFRDCRRPLKRFLNSWEGFGELSRFEMRLQLRTLSKASLLQSMVIVSGRKDFEYGKSVTKGRYSDKGLPIMPTLIVANSKTEAAIQASKVDTDTSARNKPRAYVCAIIPRKSKFKEDRERLLKICEAMEVPVFITTPPEPKIRSSVSKPKRDTHKFVALSGIDPNRTHGNPLTASAGTFLEIENPKYYLQFAESWFNIRNSRHWPSLVQYINERFPNTVIVRYARDVKRVKDLGAKNVMELLASDIRSLLTSKDARFGHCVSEGKIFKSLAEDCWDYSINVMRSISKNNAALTSEFTDFTIKNRKKFELGLLVSDIVPDSRYCYYGKDYRLAMSGAIQDKILPDEFRPSTDSKEFLRTWRFIKSLSPSFFSGLDEEEEKVARNIIRSIKNQGKRNL